MTLVTALAAPVEEGMMFPLAGGRVNNSLGGGHGVDGGHEGFLDDEFVVDGLDHRGKSVGGARSARDE